MGILGADVQQLTTAKQIIYLIPPIFNHCRTGQRGEIAIKLTTLEAVPPGQQASNIKPTDITGGSPRDLLIIHPKAGIMVY